METYGLSNLGYKVFADRYSQKSNEFDVGDGIIFTTPDGMVSLGDVVERSRYTAKINTGGDYVIVHTDTVKRITETPQNLFERVAEAVATAENGEERADWTARFYRLMNDWKFIPGGRILAAAGRQGLTYYNCFVLPSPKDSREGILDILSQMVETMSRGGGVGINLSSLRPRGSKIRGVNGISSGAVSWGDLYSFATGLISGGGSRRGALGLVMNDWHPDIIDFVNVKREEGKRFKNANLSVAISDNFMSAVEKNMDWNLVFPETNHQDYDKWTGDLNSWLASGMPTKIHKTIKARELWDTIIESAWINGEPGVWFIDRANAMSNSYYLNQLNCTNPCFEEPLPPWGVCCLGSLNLPKFITPDGATLVWDELDDAIRSSVRFLDDVIDVTPYFCNETEQLQKSERRIGLGTMGLAELLIRLGLRYGSQNSLAFINKLYAFIATSAYRASAMLASEKGACPVYQPDKFLTSGFMRDRAPTIRDEVLKHGIRNMTLLTQAPTGSVATMVGTSTGIEPFFDFCYTHNTQFGVDEEYVEVYSKFKSAHPNSQLPDYFVTARDITAEEHVAVQAAIQHWVDASISKTVNLPYEATKNDVSLVFNKLYESGCKGGTVYRDGSRKEQVLNRQVEQSTSDTLPLSEVGKPAIAEGACVRALLSKRHGATVSMKTPSGTAHVTMNHDDSGQPFEVFVEIGKGGSDLKAMAEAIGRLISLCLRITPECPILSRVAFISEQLSGIGGRTSIGLGKEKVKSLPDAIGKVIKETWLAENNEAIELKPENSSDNNDICPVCGHATLTASEGCFHCIFCGYSEC